MFHFDEKYLNRLAEDNISALAELDANGLIPAPSESLDELKKRILDLAEKIREFESELAEKKEIQLMGMAKLKSKESISPEIMDEAAEKTSSAYGFSIKWVPGFFLSKGLGLLWGGCAISFHDSPFTIFLIRANFAKKKRWLFYRREELLSHEICHIARMPIRDRPYEELFAYRISPSRLRRYLGNCFQTQYDAIFFIMPIFVLLFIQIVITFGLANIPIYPFWILAAAYPIFLLARNQYHRNIISRAEKSLQSAGIKMAQAVLFRCNSEEISTIAAFGKNPEAFRKWSAEKAGSELRWKIIAHRFLG